MICLRKTRWDRAKEIHHVEVASPGVMLRILAHCNWQLAAFRAEVETGSIELAAL